MTSNKRDHDAIVIRSSGSWCLAKEAVIRAEQAWCPEKNESSDDPISAVILAVTALETFISEICAWMQSRNFFEEEGKATPWGKLLHELEENKVKLIAKLMVLGIVFPDSKGKRLTTDAEPLQSVHLLCKLRNALVHADPRFKEPAFFKALRDKKLTHDPFPQSRSSTAHGLFPGEHWITRVTTPKVARWACDTSRRLMTDLLARIKVSPDIADHVRVRAEGEIWLWQKRESRPMS